MILNCILSFEPGVYMITNVVNNKKYIGSSNKIRIRTRRHNTDFIKNINNKLMQEDYNEGHNFIVEILEIMHNSSRTERSRKEEEYILKYKTNEKAFGYNLYIASRAPGELHSRASITNEQALQIYNLLHKGMGVMEISRKLNISYKVISGINNGAWSYVIENKKTT